jgi:hypothetical protein
MATRGVKGEPPSGGIYHKAHKGCSKGTKNYSFNAVNSGLTDLILTSCNPGLLLCILLQNSFKCDSRFTEPRKLS